jgi:hypothetical protein
MNGPGASQLPAAPGSSPGGTLEQTRRILNGKSQSFTRSAEDAFISCSCRNPLRYICVPNSQLLPLVFAQTAACKVGQQCGGTYSIKFISYIRGVRYTNISVEQKKCKRTRVKSYWLRPKVKIRPRMTAVADIRPLSPRTLQAYSYLGFSGNMHNAVEEFKCALDVVTQIFCLLPFESTGEPD